MRTSLRIAGLLTLILGGPTVVRATAQDAPAPEALKAENVEVRRNAAIRLVSSPRDAQKTALPVLIDRLMNEKDGQVRLAVLDTVTAMGPNAASAIPALVHTLKTNYGGQGKEELHQDYRSALALAAIGKPAVEALRGLLNERKENVRAEVVMALGRIGPDAESAVPDMVPLLADKSERIRRETRTALGRMGTAAVEPLIAAAGQSEIALRAGAIEALGMLSAPEDRVRQAVLVGTHDEAPDVRATAIRSLARLNTSDDALRPILGDALRHSDERVRLAAVEVLVERRELLAGSTSELASLLTAENDGVARHAAFLLSRVGPDAVPALLDALRDTRSRTDMIAEALARIGRPAVEPLTRATAAPEPRVRRGAALALGQVRPLDPGTVGTLTRGLRDPDPDVKGAFLTALGFLGPRAGEAVPAVRALLHDPAAPIRIQALDILARTAARDDQLVGDLTALLDDGEPQVQRRAIDLLRSSGPSGRQALPTVIGKLKSTDVEVRQAAAEFVGGQGQAAVEAVPMLQSLLDDPSSKLRTTAVRTLGKLGPAARPAFDRLAALLGDESVELREAVVTTLGSLELDAEPLRPALARAIRDDKPEVRRSAMNSIRKLGPQAAIFVPDIIGLAANKDNQRTVERSLRSFERGGPDPRSVPELVKLLAHDQQAVRLLAIKFLGLAGPKAKDALPALERLRDDPSDEVRKEAKTAVERIQGPAESV